MNKVQFTLTAGLLALALSIIGCDDSKPTNGNLVGAWELEDAINSSPKIYTMELFKDGTGIANGTTLKWQLRDGNRIQIDYGNNSEISGIELSEKGMLLTLHYERGKAMYNKKNEEKSGSAVNAPFTFTDERDGKKYKAVKVGNRTWMAENLNYEAEGSKCYGNDPYNCEKYGRLYNWNTAMNACPKGWHLPSNVAWDKLYRNVDGASGTESLYRSKTAGKYLKATSGWNDYEGKPDNGEDKFGFAALPGGGGFSGGGFIYAGNNGYWWSASENDDGHAYGWIMGYSYEYAGWDNYYKAYLFSVRCVQD